MVSLYLQTKVQILRAPICEPIDGEYVDECHWSKTGWAIWRDGCCSCRPALLPPEAETGKQP